MKSIMIPPIKPVSDEDPLAKPKMSCRCKRRVSICLSLLLLGLVCLVFFDVKTHQRLREHASTLQVLTQQLSAAQTKLQQTITLCHQKAPSPLGSLATVNHLVRLAYYNSRYLHDLHSAIAALYQADQLLTPLSHGPKWVAKIRSQLLNLMAALEALPPLNPVALLAELTALQAQIPKLPLRIIPSTVSRLATPATKPIVANTWDCALLKSLDRLKKLITIRYMDQPIRPFLPQEQQDYLWQNLHGLLEKAQWAVLHTQPLLYQSSLQEAQHWVQAYFADEAPVTQVMLRSLTRLKQVELQPRLPDFGPLLGLLQQTSLHY